MDTRRNVRFCRCANLISPSSCRIIFPAIPKLARPGRSAVETDRDPSLQTPPPRLSNVLIRTVSAIVINVPAPQMSLQCGVIRCDRCTIGRSCASRRTQLTHCDGKATRFIYRTQWSNSGAAIQMKALRTTRLY